MNESLGQETPIRPRLAGRRRELDLLTRTALATESVAQFVAISGKPWTGKTTLLAELVECVTRRGGLVVWGRPWGGPTPLGIFADALHDHLYRAGDSGRSHPPDADLRATVTAVLRDGDPLTVGSDTDRRRAFRAVRTLLERLAGDRCLVLVLDDVHCADPLSAELLDYLLHHPPAARVLTAIAYRPAGIGSRLSRLLRGGGSRCSRLDIGPLTPAECDALVPPGLSCTQRQFLCEAAAGNPGVLRALIAALRVGAEGIGTFTVENLRTGVPPVMPGEYLVELEPLSPRARLVAQAAAVCGDPFSLTLLREVAEVSEATAALAVDELMAADVVRSASLSQRYAFRDPVVRALAYHSGSGSWRPGARRRAAAALEAVDADAASRARQREHVAEPGDAGSARVLVAAAQATFLDTPGRAERWLRTSKRLAPGDNFAEFTVQLGKTLAVAGRLKESSGLLRTATRPDERLPAGLVAEAVEWYARASRLLGRYERAHTAVHHGMAMLADCAEVDSCGLSLELGSIALSVGSVDTDGEQRIGVAAKHEDPLKRAQALGQWAVMMAGRQRTDEALDMVRTAGYLVDRCGDDHVTRQLEALYWLAEAERLLGLHYQAAGHFGRALEVSGQRAHEYLCAYLSVGLGRVQLRMGDVDSAAKCADRAEVAADLTASDPMRSAALALRSQVYIAASDPSAAADAATLAVGLAMPLGDNWARYAQRCLVQARSALSRVPVGSTGPRRAAGTLVLESPGQVPPVRSLPVQRTIPAASPADRSIKPPGGVLNTLSRREMEIATLVSAGRTNQQIASALTLSTKTVETYLARIFKKLSITSRTRIAHLVGLTGGNVGQELS